MKLLYHFCFCALILSLTFTPAYALENLSAGQMKNTVGQAGISVGVNDLKIESYTKAFTLSDADNPDTEYVSFEGGHSTLTLSNSTTDMDGDGLIEYMTIDLFTVTDSTSGAYGQSFISLVSQDMELDYDLTIDTVNFCGKDIGSIDITNLSMPSFHMYLGAHKGTGIDAEFGARISIEKLSYGTNETDTLTFSDITFASAFSADESAPTSWEVTTWNDTTEFTIGDIHNGNPFTLDMAADNTAEWQMTDQDGVDTYTVENERNGGGFIALNMPMQGSVRIENITFGATDLGSLMINQMDVQTLYIEMPGRGLGR